jgi:hypothetical protein
MKKSVFAAMVVTMMLTVTLCLLAQLPAGQGQGQPPAGQGRGLAPAGQGRGQAPGGQARGGQQGGRGQVNAAAVNAAVTEIEKQLAALKKAMEGAQMMPGRGGQDTQKAVMGGSRGGGGAAQAMMAQNQQRSQAVQAAAAAIADQVLVLKGTQAQIEQEDAIAELVSIVDVANREKATSTVTLTQSIIDTRQKTFAEKTAKLGIGPRGGGMMGGMMGGRGGSYTPPPGGFKYNDYDDKK